MRRLLVALALLLTTVTPSHAIEVTGGGVTSLTGTANQVTVSASTGAVTLSLPDPLTPPGTLAMGSNSITSTGVVNAGTFVGVTSATVPTVIGGTAVGSSLNLQSTSGVGTTDFIRFLVGNNGATEAMRIFTNANISLGTTTQLSKLYLSGTFTPAAVGFATAFAIDTNVTANGANQNAALFYTAGTLTGGGAGQNHPNFDAFRLAPYTLTLNGATVATASSLRIQDAPTGATTNYALNVEAGAVYLGTGKVGIGVGPPVALLDLSAPANTVGIQLVGYSLTGSNASSLMSLTGTLNTSGNPDVWLLDLTNTASGATTKAMNVKVGGSSVFSVDMAGAVIAASTYTSGSSVGLTATTTVRAAGGLSDCTLIFTGGLKTGGTC